MTPKLSGAFQENLVTLVCFDETKASIIRNTVELSMFESSVLRDIASVAYDYLDRYERPIKDHLSDEFEHILNDKKEYRKAQYYEETLEAIYDLQESIHGDYVMDQLEKFARQQGIKAGITGAVDAIKNDDLDEAETILHEALNKQVMTFQAGTFMTDTASLSKAMNTESTQLPIGIPELEKYGVVPSKSEVLLYVAPPKSGKTWFSMHCCKAGVLHRWKTLVVTLEMPEEKYQKRLMQSFFSITKREAETIKIMEFEKNEYGDFIDFKTETVDDRPSFQDDNIMDLMIDQLGRLKNRAPLLIKHFPSGTLSIKAFRAYLDGIERIHNFIPDLVIVDYPDIMKLNNPANKRAELDKIYVELRGICTERNFALVAPTQSNKESKFSKRTTGEHASEAYSKKFHADTLLTYSQTKPEKALSIARLYVDAARYDRDGFEVAISQSYAMGQFCLGSAIVSNDYWSELEVEEEHDD